MTKIFDAIIFDLGGVLYNIDTQLNVKAFDELGAPDFNKLYTLKSQSILIDELEIGAISKRDFIDRIQNFYGLQLSEQGIVDAWNALLIGIDAETLQLLIQLRSRYKLYLLSNTNEIHLDAIVDYMQAMHNGASLDSFFDKAYYSFHIGLRKPNKEIFEYIIKDSNVNPASTIFIDDNADNVKAGTEAGLTGIVMEKNGNLKETLKAAGIEF